MQSKQTKIVSEQATAMTTWVKATQDKICEMITRVSGDTFQETRWDRPGGGEGYSRLIQNGACIERGGVNVSVIHGVIAPGKNEVFKEILSKKMIQIPEDNPLPFFATGISLVIHPRNPLVPTTHANYRYFELKLSENETVWWFGGGADLTPYYLNESDCKHFHACHKEACDTLSSDSYTDYKKACDTYFYLPHRKEHRGIGGIFFDYLNDYPVETIMDFVGHCGDAFIAAYEPILENRSKDPYTDKQKTWQHMRRGRYVEFNLLYDRGTHFGLKTNGRIESIFMSLPASCGWDSTVKIKPGSPEEALMNVIETPKDWI